MEEDEELAEQEERSRPDELEEMVRDMVLVFFCTLWTLGSTHQRHDVTSKAGTSSGVVCLRWSDLLFHVSGASEGSERRSFTVCKQRAGCQTWTEAVRLLTTRWFPFIFQNVTVSCVTETLRSKVYKRVDRTFRPKEQK